MLAHRIAPIFPSTGIDRLFEDFFGDAFPAMTNTACAFPAMNITEESDTITVEAELPGFRMEDIEITLEGDQLTIAGHRECDCEQNGATFRRRERMSGRFTRTIRLPYEINPDDVRASLANGVLTVTLPKHEAIRPRKIQVRAG